MFFIKFIRNYNFPALVDSSALTLTLFFVLLLGGNFIEQVVAADDVKVSANELRTFVSKEGKIIEAKILDVKGDKVKIERGDKVIFEVLIDIFTEKDVKYIRKWENENIRYDFKVSSTMKMLEKKESLEGGFDVTKQKMQRILKIRNNSSRNLENVKALYVVYIKRGNYKKKVKDKRITLVSGKMDFPKFKRYEEIEEKSKTFVIHKYRLNHNFSLPSLQYNHRYYDVCLGVRVRFFHKGKLVFEYASKMVNEQAWPTSKVGRSLEGDIAEN